MKRVLIWVVAALVVITVVASVYFRTVGDDPAVWHADPLTTKRTGKPNDYLLAPAGSTAATPDQAGPVLAMAPDALMFLIDSVATPDGARPIAGSLDEGWVTYVQRSALLGFPDYITVRAISVDGGVTPVIWSRSRFGDSDLGVNAKRVERWLSTIEP